MPKLSVAERLDKIAQRKAKDERLEARLKLIQKKADTRSAAEISRLAIKAGIDHLSPTTLYGCFLQVAADATDLEKLKAWEARGQQATRAAENDNRAVAIVKFTGKPSADTAAGLRKLGFRWNSILGQFEGRVAYDEASYFRQRGRRRHRAHRRARTRE